jgi:hypothetical protein
MGTPSGIRARRPTSRTRRRIRTAIRLRVIVRALVAGTALRLVYRGSGNLVRATVAGTVAAIGLCVVLVVLETLLAGGAIPEVAASVPNAPTRAITVARAAVTVPVMGIVSITVAIPVVAVIPVVDGVVEVGIVVQDVVVVVFLTFGGAGGGVHQDSDDARIVQPGKAPVQQTKEHISTDVIDRSMQPGLLGLLRDRVHPGNRRSRLIDR